jgi:RNA polymerase sigma-70 factor (ECF subfamily)
MTDSRNVLDVEALYRQYGPMVLRRCRSLLRDEGDALDAMQESFVQVLRRRDRLSADYPSSLMYRIATNTSLNMLRSRRRRPSSPAGELILNIAGTDDPETRVVERSLVEQVFAGERPDTREIAEARWVEGAPLEETASRAGLSVSGVRKRLATLRSRGSKVLSR